MKITIDRNSDDVRSIGGGEVEKVLEGSVSTSTISETRV